MMNAMPATRLIQNAGTKGAIAPPINAQTPSIKANANMAPKKTDLGLCLALRLIIATCVLSPNSASATIANEDSRGSKSNGKDIAPLTLLMSWYPYGFKRYLNEMRQETLRLTKAVLCLRSEEHANHAKGLKYSVGKHV